MDTDGVTGVTIYRWPHTGQIEVWRWSRDTRPNKCIFGGAEEHIGYAATPEEAEGMAASSDPGIFRDLGVTYRKL